MRAQGVLWQTQIYSIPMWELRFTRLEYLRYLVSTRVSSGVRRSPWTGAHTVCLWANSIPIPVQHNVQ